MTRKARSGHRWWTLAVAGLASVLPTGLAHAQGSAAVLGRVYEASKSQGIAGATVIARNQETAVEHETLAASDGIYILVGLLPGPYTISARHHGYRTATLADYPVRLSHSERAAPAMLPLVVLRQTGAEVAPSPPGADRRLAPSQKSREHLPDRHASIRVRWQAPIGAGGDRSPRPATRRPFTLLERVFDPGPAPRHRSPELTEGQMLVVGVDARMRPLVWDLIPDPTIMRAELPGPTGELTGGAVPQATSDFLVALPDDPAVTELRFYRPRWTGAVFGLDLLGTAPLSSLPLVPGERAQPRPEQ